MKTPKICNWQPSFNLIHCTSDCMRKKDPIASEDGVAVVDEAVIAVKAPEDIGDDDTSKVELVLCPSSEKTNGAGFASSSIKG
ncbi:hypothetical protein AAC387_Pa01g0385 [Persea americana]